jgi:hypothetical protein
MPQTERVLAVSFQLTIGDLFRALFWFNLRKFWIITVVVPICFVITAFTSGGENIPLGAAIVFAFWAMITLVSPYLGARAAMKSPSSQGVIRYAFTDAGIDITATHSSGHMDWEMIMRVAETNRFIVMFPAKNMMHLVPKSSLSVEDLAALKAQLRRSVRGKVHLRN